MSKALAVMSYLNGLVMFEEMATLKVSNRTGKAVLYNVVKHTIPNSILFTSLN
jgi:hypothetical protein